MGMDQIVTIHPWVDPLVDDLGHDPRGAYTERYWLSVIGPTAMWIMRRIADLFDTSPDGFALDCPEGEAGMLLEPRRAGHRGDSPDHWHYAASKAGMLAMHKTIARAYAGKGILSFAVAPGFTDTAMAGDYLASRGGAGILADIPLGRVATSEEIARIAAFCVLDAPASMTGAVIDANGASYVR